MRRRTRSSGRGDMRRVLKMLREFGRPHQRWFVFAVILLAIEAGAAVFEAYPLAFLVDFLSGRRAGLLPSRNGTVAVLSVGVLVIASLNSLADSLAEVCLARGGRRLGFDLRVGLYNRLTKLSMAFHDRRRTGDTLTRMTGDVTAVEDFVVKSFSDLTGSVFILIGTVVFLATHSLPVTLVAMVMVPALAGVSTWFSKRIKEAAKRHRAREGDLASDAQEMLTSIRVIQSFGRGYRQERDFAEHSELAMRAALDSARIEAGFSWVVSVLQATSTVAVIWVGLFLIDRRQLSVGTLLLFIILIQNMFKPTRRIIKEWNSIAKVFASVERIGELLDREVEVADAADATDAPRFTGEIELRDVTFSYTADSPRALATEPAPRVLDHVSFTVRSGEMVALVGPSGAGKSTIAQLVPRLYDPESGQVLIDGTDVRSVTLASLRRQISMVLQETILFTGTVAENVAFGADDVDLSTIRDAARRANAHEFIEQLPHGYQTVLSERASNLSGGQRQRISIARAFIRNSPILILDEPTTGLDAGSVDSVLSALLALAAGKTTLLISHDLSLTRCADRILVIDGGRIVEDGRHTDLIEASGLYASLYARQLAFETGNEEDDDDSPAKSRVATMTDPLDGMALHREFAGLADALDLDAMRPIIAGLLAPGFRLTSITAGKFRYDHDKGCTMRYELDIVDEIAGKLTHRNVGARVCPDRTSSVLYYEAYVLPIAQRTSGSDELRAFVRPASLVSLFNMVLYAHPIDPELPTLFDALEPRVVQRLVKQAMAALGRDLVVESTHVDLVRYPRHNRCVLRYVSPQDVGPDRELYVKVFAPSIALPAVETVTQLRAIARAGRLETFDAPALLVADQSLHLTVLEAMPGQPIVTALIRLLAVPDEGAVAEGALNEALGSCARIAATVHQSGIRVSNRRTWADDRVELADELAELEALDSDLGDHMRRQLAVIDRMARAAASTFMVLCHGDFTPSQVLFHDEGVVLLDFDTLVMSEPALDLGRFCAYLRVAVRKDVVEHASLEQQLILTFLEAYTAVSQVDERRLRDRVAFHEIISLYRITLHAWRHLKGARLRMALAALDDVVAAYESVRA